MQKQLNQQTEMLQYQSTVRYLTIEKSYYENMKAVKPIYEVSKKVQSLIGDFNFSIEEMISERETNHEHIVKLLKRIREINKATAAKHKDFVIPDFDLLTLYEGLFGEHKKPGKYLTLKLSLIKSAVKHWEYEFIKNLQNILPADHYMATAPFLFVQVNKPVLELGERFEANLYYLSILTGDSKFIIGDFDPVTSKPKGKQEAFQINKGFGIYQYTPLRKGKNKIQGVVFQQGFNGNEILYPFISQEFIVE